MASWAKDSVELAVDLSIISGSNGKLNPTGTASRAELAQMLLNFDTVVPAA